MACGDDCDGLGGTCDGSCKSHRKVSEMYDLPKNWRISVLCTRRFRFADHIFVGHVVFLPLKEHW